MQKIEALQIIDQALSQLQTTHTAHIQLQLALEVLAKELDSESMDLAAKDKKD